MKYANRYENDKLTMRRIIPNENKMNRWRTPTLRREVSTKTSASKAAGRRDWESSDR